MGRADAIGPLEHRELGDRNVRHVAPGERPRVSGDLRNGDQRGSAYAPSMTEPEPELAFHPLIALCAVSAALWSEAWFDAADAALEWFWVPLAPYFEPDYAGMRLLDVPMPID